MKLEKVIPLYKRHSSEVALDFRPISLLSVFSRMVEKSMHFRIYNFL